MNWSDAFSELNKPCSRDIESFIKSGLYGELCAFLESEYKISPEIVYSGCSAQPGWNIKYKKSGRSLCTIYPMDGYFITLIVIGNKEQPEAEMLLPTFTDYIRETYERTAFSCGGRWLMISVTDDWILSDVKRLVAIRSGGKR